MIEFRFARHRQFAILGGTLFTALVFGLIEWKSGGRLQVVAGVAAVLFGVIAPAIHLPRLFMSGVALRIDEQGIEDSRIGAGLVRWEEIAHMAVRNVGPFGAIEVYPHRPWEVVERMPLFQRAIGSLSVLNKKPAMLLQFQDIEPGFDEALKAIEVLSAARGGLAP